MKKLFKIICIIIFSVLCVYTLFIVEESIRLKNGGNAPLIILRDSGYCDGNKMEHTENKYITNCKGIGYQIKREYILSKESSDDNRIYIMIKEEFWLFDRFLLWGWIS